MSYPAWMEALSTSASASCRKGVRLTSGSCSRQAPPHGSAAQRSRGGAACARAEPATEAALNAAPPTHMWQNVVVSIGQHPCLWAAICTKNKHGCKKATLQCLLSTSCTGSLITAAQSSGTALFKSDVLATQGLVLVCSCATCCGTLKDVMAAATARPVTGVDGAEPRAVLDARLTTGEVFADDASAAAVVFAPQVAPGSSSSASATCSSVATCRFCRAAEKA